MNIADELTIHAKQELDHALQISNHVDYLGPESGVKIAILELDRFQSVNLAQDVISQIL